MERSKWAKVREQWIKNDPEKKDALHWIESAITVLNLDVLGNKEFEDKLKHISRPVIKTAYQEFSYEVKIKNKVHMYIL